MDLHEISAHLEIQQAVARYSRGVDRCDAELMKSAFHPGAIQEFGAYVGDAAEFCDMIVPNVAATTLMTMHGNMNHSIELEENGEVAHGELYNNSTVWREEADGTQMVDTWWGRYLDRYERRNGEWRIARRAIVHELTRTQPLGELMPMEGREHLRQGSADRGVRKPLGLREA